MSSTDAERGNEKNVREGLDRKTTEKVSRRDSGLDDVGISRRQLLGAVGVTAVGSHFALGAAGATEPNASTTSDTGAAIVVLELEPLARQSGDRSDHAQKLAAQREAFKKWMAKEAPETDVIYEYDNVLNGLAVRLNGHSTGSLRKGPNVRYVTRSKPVFPTLGESVSLIDAVDAWTKFETEDLAGAGVKVAIIDSGIEHDRPFFADDGFAFPEGEWPKGNGDEWEFDVGEFTNEKVITAYVFWDEDLDLDPSDHDGHGTHVAGIAGGRADTLTDLGVEVSGVAPGVWLGNYNVFPGDVLSTAEENVIAAVEQAVVDGFDVINMSLGGPIDKPEDPLMEASENAIESGVVVVASAGNSGPESGTVGSPAAAPNVIAVGASTNAWAVFDTLSVSDGGEEVGPVAYLPGFDGGEIHEEILDAPLVAWADLQDLGSTTELACDSQGNPNDVPTLEGNPVVIVQRGECTFAEKAQNIKDAGGRAMIVYNSDGEDELVTMDIQGEVDFPSAFVTNTDGRAIREFIANHSDPEVDITFDEEAFDREPNELAEFSSRGPGPELEIKPEITAPGVEIYSSFLDGGWAALSGTSMSSPHTAGSAALLVALEPDWEVWEVRSALVNNADAPVDVNTGVDGPMGRGNGLLQVGDATESELLADPATVSFGELANRGPAFRTSAERDLSIENVFDSAQTIGVTVVGQTSPAPDVSVSSSEVTVGTGEVVTLTLTADGRGQATGTYWGRIAISGGPDDMTVPFWYRVSP